MLTWGDVSGWWTPVCLLLGILYAWIMYRQPVSLTGNIRNWLAGLRVLSVFIIAFLLISPLIRSTAYQPSKPLVLVAQDNSASVNIFKPKGFDSRQLINDLAKLKHLLGDQYEVREFNFDHDLKEGLSAKFDGKQTNISEAVHQLNDRFANQNIGALVLATDGLYNQGSDPQYEAKNLKASIYTIALGDTILKRDMLVGNVNYNQTAYLGNDFVIEVLAEAYQCKGDNLQLSILEDGRQVYSQTIPVKVNDYKKSIPVKLNADKKGIHKFTVNITPVKNEISVQNNTETIYVDVLDAKQRILVLYQSPHPDISVIKQSIESDKNYEVKTCLTANMSSVKLNDYSLIILYQVNANISGILQNFIVKGKVPVWYLLGSQTDVGIFNNEQKLIQINAGRQEMQEVFAQPEPGFASFTLSDSTRNKISALPPLQAPFGNYSSAAGTQALLKQKIGKITTTFPLLAFSNENNNRVGVLTGEGLWRWQLAEFQAYGNHHAMEELMSQSVQYLTANASHQRFRVYTAKNTFDEGENVIINAELNNDALEAINTPDVKIDLKGKTGKNYSFLFSRLGKGYQLNAGVLPAGDYSYTASTKLSTQTFTANGQLTVKALNLEARQSTANHKVLSSLASQSGGQMLQPSQINQLASLIRKNENIKTVVYEDKRYRDIIDLKWVFILILTLLSVEWLIRKHAGEI